MADENVEVIVFANIKPSVSGLMLNIGSGDSRMDGYINIDKYNKNSDADWDAGSLPLNDCSVAIIQCHQTIEHFEHTRINDILFEWFRVLKPDGQIHVTTPDIVASCKMVVDNPDNLWMRARIFGHQGHDGQFHKWGYTAEEFNRLLGFIGFSVIEIARYLQCNEPYLYVRARR